MCRPRTCDSGGRSAPSEPDRQFGFEPEPVSRFSGKTRERTSTEVLSCLVVPSHWVSSNPKPLNHRHVQQLPLEHLGYQTTMKLCRGMPLLRRSGLIRLEYLVDERMKRAEHRRRLRLRKGIHGSSACLA